MTKNNQKAVSTYEGDEQERLEIKRVFGIFWKCKFIILLFGCFGLVLGITYSLTLPNKYVSEVTLAPVKGTDSPSNGLSSSFGGLASLAGVNLNGGGSDKVAKGLEILESRKFFKLFIKKNDFLVEIMAVKDWDGSSLTIDEAIYDTTNNEWLTSNKYNGKPSLLAAHKVFLKHLNVSVNKETGFIKIMFEHNSPVTAQKILEALVYELNSMVKERDVAQAKRSIKYLNEQIENNSLMEVRSGLFELIQNQMETIMLANANPEYLFETLDPAVIPENKSKPNRTLIVAFTFLLSSFLGLFFVLFRASLKNEI